MSEAILTGSGLFTPSDGVTNAELVASHTAAAQRFNASHADDIAAGRNEPRDETSDRWIVKASGVKHRYFLDKTGVLDPERLCPRLPLRGEEELSIQAEMCVAAVEEALAQAGVRGADLDAVIVACSNLQRAYPAVAIEVQHALGATGWAYDLNVACSSATFGIQAAVDAVRNGSAKRVVVVNPEITSGHNNFELRDYHFIFGDACTAVLIEARDACTADTGFEVLSTRLETHFSNNIRNDFGFLNRSEDGERDPHELVFRQNGRKVYRDVCPLVAQHITRHLEDLSLAPAELRRMWLHQANLGMNELIAKTVLGREAGPDEAPVILDEFANTSSAGSVIAFHRHHRDLATGDLGVLCSFGAGYSIGSAVLRRIELV